MKKTLLILSILLAFGTVKAQNGATKKETITWISSYGKELIHSGGYLGFSYDNEIKFHVRVKEANDYFVLYADDSEDIYMYQKIYIKEINIVKLTSNNKLQFTSLNNSFPTIKPRSDDSQREFFTSNGWIKLKDEESAKRFYKAIKHLLSFYDYKIEYEDVTKIKNKF